MSPRADLVAPLLAHLRQVCDLLGLPEAPEDAAVRFADAIDSMGFVEFLALVADDCGVPVEAIEQASGRRYGTVGELAAALEAAALRPRGSEPSRERPGAENESLPDGRGSAWKAWLAASTVRLPSRIQPAVEINRLLERPPGWLEDHAAIHGRGLWADEDVLDAAAENAAACLSRAGLSLDGLGALLVTAEAPPVLTGLAAALHQRLGLSAGVVALEIGGACTGFLAAMWTALRLLVDTAAVLVVAVEAPSRWLTLQPGPAGETAALFGDATAACLLTAQPMNAGGIPLCDILLGTDGAASSLLQVRHDPAHGATLHMDGVPLAHRAVRSMAESVRHLAARHGLAVDQLGAVVAHGGNGRMSDLLARRLLLPVPHVWSETTRLGNLGSASLPVAFALHPQSVHGPIIWTAVGAGLQWGAALFGLPATGGVAAKRSLQ